MVDLILSDSILRSIAHKYREINSSIMNDGIEEIEQELKDGGNTILDDLSSHLSLLSTVITAAKLYVKGVLYYGEEVDYKLNQLTSVSIHYLEQHPETPLYSKLTANAPAYELCLAEDFEKTRVLESAEYVLNNIDSTENKNRAIYADIALELYNKLRGWRRLAGVLYYANEVKPL